MLTDAKNEIQIVDYRGPTQSVENDSIVILCINVLDLAFASSVKVYR